MASSNLSLRILKCPKIGDYSKICEFLRTDFKTKGQLILDQNIYIYMASGAWCFAR